MKAFHTVAADGRPNDLTVSERLIAVGVSLRCEEETGCIQLYRQTEARDVVIGLYTAEQALEGLKSGDLIPSEEPVRKRRTV